MCSMEDKPMGISNPKKAIQIKAGFNSFIKKKKNKIFPIFVFFILQTWYNLKNIMKTGFQK